MSSSVTFHLVFCGRISHGTQALLFGLAGLAIETCLHVPQPQQWDYRFELLLSLVFKWMLVIPTQALMLAWQTLYSTEPSLQPLVDTLSQRLSFCLQGSL